MIYNITTRIPYLMKQSHLERNEGKKDPFSLNAESTALTYVQ